MAVKFGQFIPRKVLRDRQTKTFREAYYMYRWDKRVKKDFVDKRTYKKIAVLYMKALIKEVNKGIEVSLPEGMGCLSIRGKNQRARYDKDGNLRGIPIDWVETKKLRANNPEAAEQRLLAYCLNHDTEGIRFSYRWEKYKIEVKNRELYSLRIARSAKRATSAEIKINNGVQFPVKLKRKVEIIQNE